MVIKRKVLTPIDFEGLEIFDYTAGREEQSSFAVISVPPGTVHGLSRSKRSDKYYYIADGDLQFTLENDAGNLEETTVSAGDFLLVHKGKRFDYCNRSPKSAEIILVHTPRFDIESEEFL